MYGETGGRAPAMNTLLGYGYHPWATATYMQRSLEARAEVTFVGAPGQARPGFAATGDLGQIVASLPAKPNLYLYVDSSEPRYFPRGLADLGFPTACYLVDVHLRQRELARQAMFFDYAFSTQRDFVGVLRKAGHPQVHWLPLACDPQVHRRHDVPKRYDIGFIGSVRGGYERRGALLARLAGRFTTNDYQRALAPSEMAHVYSEARLVFNCSLRHEINMRAFEGPASGSLLLTDRIGNGLDELFTDREHVVMYDDDRLVELAEEFLRDEAARERIAANGYEHVRAHHTYDHRIETILNTVFAEAGPRLAAPVRRLDAAHVHLAYAGLFAEMGRVDDTIEEFTRVPRRWRYRVPAAKELALCLLRRGHYLLTV